MNTKTNWLDKIFGQSNASDSESFARDAAPSQSSGILPYRFTNDDLCIAAIGDLHGRLDLLQKHFLLLDEIAANSSKRLVEVYVGDYVDRGPNSAQLLETLIERRKLTDRYLVYLRGNHEAMMLAALDDDAAFRQWVGFGGDTTMLSYGVSPVLAIRETSKVRQEFKAALPEAHITFLRELEDFYVEGGFLFVHAGIRPGLRLEDQKLRDMHWIREPFLSSTTDIGLTVVHGHTPTLRPTFRLNRIGIDTGAYQTGNLTCVLINSEGVTIHETSRKNA